MSISEDMSKEIQDAPEHVVLNNDQKPVNIGWRINAIIWLVEHLLEIISEVLGQEQNTE